MEQLFLLFDHIQRLSDPLREYLLSVLRRKEVKKKEIILERGKVSKYIYFIEKGLVRAVRHEHGRERTAWVMMEGDIIVSVESFFQEEDSTETIEALEDCVLHCISRKELYDAYRLFPEFNLHRGVILEKYYPLSEARNRMRLKKARDKFEELMTRQPELIGRVKDKILASYLGVTPGTFSLEKKRFANRLKKQPGEGRGVGNPERLRQKPIR